MASVKVNSATSQRLAEFVALYLGKSPTLREIEEYVQQKLEEKDICNAFKHELVTKEEVCSFVTAHVHTRFVQDEVDVLKVDAETISTFHDSLKKALFES